MRRFMLALAVVLALPATAHATFPGQNGKIVFGGNGIHTINPDGTGLAEVIAVNGVAVQPTWSADGNRIAFSSNHGDPGCAPVSCNYDIYVVDADGSNLLRLTTDPGRDSNPMWSPDGAEIRFLSNRATNPDIFRVDSTGGNEALVANTGHQEEHIAWSPDAQTMAFSANPSEDPEIYSMNPDGTGVTQLTVNSDFDHEPSWSPDSQRIAWWTEIDGCSVCEPEIPYHADVFVMNRDGTGKTNLISADTYDWHPVWSPDGTKIAFLRDDGPQPGLYIMNPDGTGVTFIASNTQASLSDWQALPTSPPPSGYARPKGATPFQVYLVPAYNACGSPNRTHGPPLAFPSCNPPQRSSATLTVGTADSNGAPAKYIGKFRYDVLNGDPATAADEADVRIEVIQTDVRWASDLTDYTGELRGDATVRVTDRFNAVSAGGGTDPATLVDIPFPTGDINCTATADPTVGADCNLTTTFEALVPGAISERKRTIVEIGQVKISDGGPDGDAGTAPNTLFAVQGIFIP